MSVSVILGNTGAFWLSGWVIRVLSWDSVRSSCLTTPKTTTHGNTGNGSSKHTSKWTQNSCLRHSHSLNLFPGFTTKSWNTWSNFWPMTFGITPLGIRGSSCFSWQPLRERLRAPFFKRSWNLPRRLSKRSQEMRARGITSEGKLIRLQVR